MRMSGETKSLGQKDKLDKFYTKSSVAKICMDTLFDQLGNKKEEYLFIEPSAGAGVFLSFVDNYIAFDIEPENVNIIKANWFEVDKEQFNNQKVIVFGNPPFGIQGKAAINFFNESSFANYIAFILPRSFRKPSVQDKLHKNFHLIREIILPKNSFIFQKTDYDVNCVFQIWEKSPETRKPSKRRLTTKFFDFTKNAEEASCSVRRVGAAAGKASLNKNFSPQSNYFLINKTNLTDEDFVAFLNSLTHDRANDAVGPKSLSKTELIEDFEANFFDIS